MDPWTEKNHAAHYSMNSVHMISYSKIILYFLENPAAFAQNPLSSTEILVQSLVSNQNQFSATTLHLDP
jgi:hypothetical protein